MQAPTETISEEDRTRIVNIVTVLRTLQGDHFSTYTYRSEHNNIDAVITTINQGQDAYFRKNSPLAQIALTFLEEFNKLEKVEGRERVTNAINAFTSHFSEHGRPDSTNDFSNDNLKAARQAIVDESTRWDKMTQEKAKTKFLAAFYKAMDRPDLIPPEIQDQPQPQISRPPTPSAACTFWRVAAGVVSVGIAAGLIYDSTQHWNFLKSVCHAIASHPEISAPVVAVLFLAFVAVCYGYYKSKGEEAGNPLQPSIPV